MKSLLIAILKNIITIVAERILRRPPQVRTHVYSKNPVKEEYLVGYWAKSGNFVKMATVETEEQAVSLCAELNA